VRGRLTSGPLGHVTTGLATQDAARAKASRKPGHSLHARHLGRGLLDRSRASKSKGSLGHDRRPVSLPGRSMRDPLDGSCSSGWRKMQLTFTARL
jgi:hypothetical protein